MAKIALTREQFAGKRLTIAGVDVWELGATPYTTKAGVETTTLYKSANKYAGDIVATLPDGSQLIIAGTIYIRPAVKDAVATIVGKAL